MCTRFMARFQFRTIEDYMSTFAKQIAHGVIEIVAPPMYRQEEVAVAAPAPASVQYAVSNETPPPPVVQNRTGDIEPAAEDDKK